MELWQGRAGDLGRCVPTLQRCSLSVLGAVYRRRGSHVRVRPCIFRGRLVEHLDHVSTFSVWQIIQLDNVSRHVVLLVVTCVHDRLAVGQLESRGGHYALVARQLRQLWIAADSFLGRERNVSRRVSRYVDKAGAGRAQAYLGRIPLLLVLDEHLAAHVQFHPVLMAESVGAVILR